MPITWRNIEAPSLAGVAGMAESARRTFNDAMTSLRGSFDEYGEQIQTQWDQGKEANTQAFLDKLAQYKTPEELAAAQAAGEIQEFRQQFGNKIDAATVRDAEANMQQKLIERITAQNQYGDYNLDRGQRDQINETAMRAAQGDPKAIEAMKAFQNNPYFADYLKTNQGLLNEFNTNRREDTKVALEGERVGFERERVGFERDNHQFTVNERKRQEQERKLINKALFGTESQQDGTAALVAGGRAGLVDAENVLLAQSNLQKLNKTASQLTQGQESEVDNLTFNQLAADSGDPTGYWLNFGKQLGMQPTQLDHFMAQYGDARVTDWKSATSREAEKNASLLGNKDVTEGAAYQTLFKETPDEKDTTASNVRDVVTAFKADPNNRVPESFDMGPVLMEAAKQYGVDDPDWWDAQVESGKLKDILGDVYRRYAHQLKLKTTADTAASYTDSEVSKKKGKLAAENLKRTLYPQSK